MEAFSDGVIAILITIMVLELEPPREASLAALRPLIPTFFSYLLSYIFLGIYWSNHHHLLHSAQRINGRILWANLHLLFWLSLVPFVTGWMGHDHHAALPTAAYGAVMACAGIAYYILAHTLMAAQGHDSRLAHALGRDRKGQLSVVAYLVAIVFAFVSHWLSDMIYAGVTLVWLVPDRRMESRN